MPYISYLIYAYISQLHKNFLCGPQSTSKLLGLSFQRLLRLQEVELFFTNHLFKLWETILLTSNSIIWFLLFYFVLFSFRHWSIFPSFKLLCSPVINWWIDSTCVSYKVASFLGCYMTASLKAEDKVLAFCLKKKT